MDLQRNDPCHCGSGRKYKKCCQKADQAEARFGRRKRDVRTVIGPKTIPYFFWKRWNIARSRGEFGLLFDMTLEEGEFRQAFEGRADFLTKAQQKPLPGGPEWVLRKIKLDERIAHVLSARGLDDPTSRQYELELMTLARTDGGWRLSEVATKKVTKGDQEVPLVFDEFEIASAENAHNERLAGGWERPDLADPDSVKFEGLVERPVGAAGIDESLLVADVPDFAMDGAAETIASIATEAIAEPESAGTGSVVGDEEA